MTKGQIDRLGERLRKGLVGESELRALDEYRRSFDAAHEQVVRLLRSRCDLASTQRSKTESSVRAKLRREATIRLSQIRDIAGCRVVTKGIVEQDDVIRKLSEVFSRMVVDDLTKGATQQRIPCRPRDCRAIGEDG